MEPVSAFPTLSADKVFSDRLMQDFMACRQHITVLTKAQEVREDGTVQYLSNNIVYNDVPVL
jgi:hypothetical protein